jgi:hypothetical protein
MSPSSRRPAHPALAALACTLALAATASAADATPAATDSPPVPAVAPSASAAPAAANPNADAAAVPTPRASTPDRWYSLGGTLSAGYDSNVLLAADTTPSPSGQHSAALGAEAHATVRILDTPGTGLVGDDTRRLALGASAGYTDYPDHESQRLLRLGGNLVGHQRFGAWDPGVLLSYNHYELDGKAAANVIGGDAFVSHLYPSYQNVDIATAGVQYLAFPRDHDQTGTLLGLGVRHWFLPYAKDTYRRIEIGLAGSDYLARAHDQSYLGFSPSLGAAWRIGADDPHLGTVDLGALAQFEHRGFRAVNPIGNEREHQQILSLTATGDCWLCANATLGAYGGLARRVSNIPGDQYTRFQVGVRLGVVY